MRQENATSRHNRDSSFITLLINKGNPFSEECWTWWSIFWSKQLEQRMYYFGYGSNLRASFVTELIPSAKFVMKGYLPNYEVQWRAWSAEYRGGISSISETPGEIVQGAIYECAEKELEKLDYIPGIYVPEYKRETFVVLGEDDKWHSMELYRLWELKGPFPPSRIYVEGMREGAKQIGVSPDYLEKIEGWLRQSIVAVSDEP